MTLFKQKMSEKLTKSELARAERLKRQLKPTTQNTLAYTSLFQGGLMHIVGDSYSTTFRLGEASYLAAEYEQQLTIGEAHAKAFNAIDAGSSLQLLILNKRVSEDVLHQVLYEKNNDSNDSYRAELNAQIQERFDITSNNFEIRKYMTISQNAIEKKQAQLALQDVGVTLENIYKSIDVSFQLLTEMERLSVFSEILNGVETLPYTYHDLRISGLTSKDLIAPDVIEFDRKDIKINEMVSKTLYIKYYPKSMEDDLIKELTSVGIELAISIHATAYDTEEIIEDIEEAQAEANVEQIRSVKRAATSYIPTELVLGSQASDDFEEAGNWRKEVKERDQNIFRGLILVHFKAGSHEELALHQSKIERVGRKVGVRFGEIYYHQEEALNTVLPIGKNYLDLHQNVRIKKVFPRSMTTANLATQIPFSSVDFISKSLNARYYGQNQVTHNIISIDRKNDLYSASGVIVGATGSGKSVVAKNEIISTLLKYKRDKVIVIDPEAEYLDIGREFGAEIIDISVGTETSFNLMDLPDEEKLLEEDRDPEGAKSNFLVTLFTSLLSDFRDETISLIDRVTRLTYKRFEQPTLKEWHRVLREQEEVEAKRLALKLEIYTLGSYDIFSKATSVNLDNRFIIFNLQRLSGQLKHFALLVIQDFIWNQVVEARAKGEKIWFYFDELQLYFEEDYQATYFNHLWSRIRKYGCIPTGITQMPETLTGSPQGRKLLGNSHFKILLKLEGLALREVKKVVKLTEQQARYIERPKAKGTGLIVAGDIVVPFENPISKESKLYRLIATDA
ncbi:VirB4-like conjugal transfer ATPase, CD1110 family [Streptococcus respiraculi]|uniref:VirB4-like conjugal transfer ATPase, CD1110 family n=1 Tax=Streptococcus respiraculi TaxID=2021971 RepID=UPI000E71A3EC|nr:DUF87 domain-containing protein [Streptococcus respiraculi]